MKKNLPITQRERTYDDTVAIVSMTDPKGIITYVNRDFLDVSGFSEEELLGKNHNIVRHPDMPPQAFQQLWDTVKAGKAWSGVVKNRCKNGDHYWVDAFVTPLYEGPRLAGYQSVRTRPSREQIEQADILYRKMNEGKVKELPSGRGIFDLGLKVRIFAALVLLGLLALAAGVTGVAGSNVINQHFANLEGPQPSMEQLARLAAAPQQADGGAALAAAVREHLAQMKQDQSRYVQAKQVAEITRNAVIAICLAGLVVILVTGSLLSRHVIGPMFQVMEIAKGIAGGDLKQAIKVRHLDEIGQMLQALKMMQARLRTLIGRIAESSATLVSAGTQLTAMTAQTRDGMGAQQSETAEVARAMSRMAETIAEVARETLEGARAASEANQGTVEGRKVMEQSIASIKGLADQVDAATAVIERLGEESQAIGSILDVIGGIAEQTNLLALNAAIEAARAGDQGRGFAVVADEVRSLAARTQESTQQIQQMIERLQAGTRDAVQTMHQGTGKVEESVRQADGAGEALRGIATVVGNINAMNTQVAAAAEEQSGVALEIDGKLARISELSQQTVQSAEETAAAGAQIARRAHELEEIVGQFDV
ncbi:methyl-accepting chemotaxis protein [Endothiovibrio diazotrophicus]